MLRSADRSAAGGALFTAEDTQSPIAPLREQWPGIDVEDAYEIQLGNIRRKTAAGRTIRGHKVGLSARAMQRMLGVDEPDYGHLLDDMVLSEGSTIATTELCQPRIEVEVAFVLSRTLEGPGISAADVMRATDFVVPALEIIDSRIRDWKITLCDTIADNASSARVVLGGRPTSLNKVDPRTIGAVLRRDGVVVGTGASGAVLGNPITAVAWLANKVASFGVALEAGQVVMPGSCTKAFDAVADTHFCAEFDTLGPVEVMFS
jgi:2-keto-4-pentenoate hydratase